MRDINLAGLPYLKPNPAASAAYGMGLYKNSERDFRTILGCAVMNLGYYSEANYHLDNGESEDGLKEKCLARIEEYRKH